MFDFSWAEMIVVLVVGLLLIGPEELPSVIKNVKEVFHKLKNMGSEFTASMLESAEIDDIKKEADKINKDIHTIIDLDGNEQIAYDVDEAMRDIKKTK